MGHQQISVMRKGMPPIAMHECFGSDDMEKNLNGVGRGVILSDRLMRQIFG
jgi:hypothetical protein